MDQFTAEATWDEASSDSIVVQFKGNLLTGDKLIELKRLRSRTRPLALHVPGCDERKATIVGFNKKDNAFYLSWINSGRPSKN